MRTNRAVFRIGALLLMLAVLCGCGKKGRLYIPPEQDSASLASARPALMAFHA
jgi:predicted small lipoprotein YifL